MRVLHLPIVICSQPWLMSRFLRKAGVKSDYMVLDDNDCGWIMPGKPDFNLNIYHRPLIDNRMTIIRDKQLFFIKSLFKYDIFHFHSNYSLFDNFIDLKILKALGKKIVVSYWGCDIRQKSINENYPYNTCQYCIVPCREKEKNDRKEIFAKYADLKIVHGPELMEYAPEGSILLNLFMDIEFWQSNIKAQSVKNRPVRVLHSFGNQSSRGDVKGTTLIEKAIKRLKKEGYWLEYVSLDKVPNYGQKDAYLKADFVIEQVRYGVYGLTALEAMALEKPVITFVRDKYLKFYPGLPIINANPDNLYEKTKWMLNNPAKWRSIGKKSREYVLKNHNAKILTRKLIKLYESI